MRILQGKSSLPLGNNPRPGGSFYQDSFLGPDKKVKSQDVLRTSEVVAPDCSLYIYQIINLSQKQCKEQEI